VAGTVNRLNVEHQFFSIKLAVLAAASRAK